MSFQELVNEVKRVRTYISGKYEQTMGLRIWGSTTGDESGTLKVLKTESDGKLSTST